MLFMVSKGLVNSAQPHTAATICMSTTFVGISTANVILSFCYPVTEYLNIVLSG